MSKANKTRQQNEPAPPAVGSGAPATTRSPITPRRQPTPGSSEVAIGAQARSPPLASPLVRSGSASTSPQQRVVTTLSQRMLQYTSVAGARAAVTNYSMGTSVVSPNGSRAYFTQSKQAIVAQGSPYPSPPRARAPTPLATINWKPGDQQSLTTEEHNSTDTHESMVTHTGRTTGRTSVSDGEETSEGLPSTASAGNDAPTSLPTSSLAKDAINKSAAATESVGTTTINRSHADNFTNGQLPDIKDNDGEDTNVNISTVSPSQVLEEATGNHATAAEKLPVQQWHAVHDFPDNGLTSSTNEKTANDSGAVIESGNIQSATQDNSDSGVIQTLGGGSVGEDPAQTADLNRLPTARISSTGSENSDGSAAAGEGGTETNHANESAATKMTRLSPMSVSSAKNRTGKSTPSSAGSAASEATVVTKQNAASQKPSIAVTERTSGDTKTSYSGSRTTAISATTKSGQVSKSSLSGSKNTPTSQTAASLVNTQAPVSTKLSASTFGTTNPEHSDTNTRDEQTVSEAKALSATGSATTHATSKTAVSTKSPTATSRPTESVTNTTRFSPSVMSSAPKASDEQAPSLTGSEMTQRTTKTAVSTKSPTATSRPTESVANTTRFSPSVMSSAPQASDEQPPSLTGSEMTQRTTKTAVSTKSPTATSRPTESVANTARFSPSVMSSAPQASDEQAPSLTGSEMTQRTTKTAVSTKSPTATSRPTESVANTTRFSPSVMSSAPQVSDEQAPSLTGSEMTQRTTKTAVSTKSPADTSKPTESVVNTTMFSPSIASSATKASNEQSPSLTGSETTQATIKTAITTNSAAATSLPTESVADITTLVPSFAPSGRSKSGGETSSLAGSATTNATKKTAAISESPVATSRPAESVANTTNFSPSSVSAATKASDKQAESATGSDTTKATAKSAVTSKSPTAASRPTGSVANTTRFSPSIVSITRKESDEKAASSIGSETTQGTTKTAGTTNSSRKTFQQTESVPSTSILPNMVSTLPNNGDEETRSLTGIGATLGHVETSDANKPPAVTPRPAESATNTTTFSPSVVSSAPKASGEKAPSLTASLTTSASTKKTVTTKSPAAKATPTESVANTSTFSPSIISSAPKLSEKQAISLKESATTQASTKLSGTSSSPTGALKQTDLVAITGKSLPLAASPSPKASTETKTSLVGSVTTQAKTSDGNKSEKSGPTESDAITATLAPSIGQSASKTLEKQTPSLTETTKTQATTNASDVVQSSAVASRPTESVANSAKFSPSIESSAQASSKKQAPSLTGSATTQATPKTAVRTISPADTSTATESVANTAKGSPSAVSSAQRTSHEQAPSLTVSAATRDTTKTAKTSKSPTDTARPTESLANTTANSPSLVSSARNKGLNETASSTGSGTTLATTNVAATNAAPVTTPKSPSRDNATTHSSSTVSSAKEKHGEESRASSGLKHSLPDAAASKAKEKSTGLPESSGNVSLRNDFKLEGNVALPAVSPAIDQMSERTNSGFVGVVKPEPLRNTSEQPSGVIKEATSHLPLVASAVTGGRDIATAEAVDIIITRSGNVPNSFSTKDLSGESNKTRAERAHSAASSEFHSPCVSSPDEAHTDNAYASSKSVPSKALSNELTKDPHIEAVTTPIRHGINASATTFPEIKNAINFGPETITATTFAPQIAATPYDETKKQESNSGIRVPYSGSSLSAGKSADLRMTSLHDSAAGVATEIVAPANKSATVAELPASAKVSTSSHVSNTSVSQYKSTAEVPPESPITKLTASTLMSVTTATNGQPTDLSTRIFTETTQVTIQQQLLIDDKAISAVKDEAGVQMAPASRIAGANDTVGAASSVDTKRSLPLMENMGKSSIPASGEVSTALEALDTKEGNGHAKLSKDDLPTRVSTVPPASPSPPLSIVDAMVPNSSLDGIRNDAQTNEGAAPVEQISPISQLPSLSKVEKILPISLSLEPRSSPVQEASESRPQNYSANAAISKKQRTNTTVAAPGGDENNTDPTTQSSTFSVRDGRVVAIMKAPVVMMPAKEINVDVQSSGVAVTKEEPAIAESMTSTLIHDAGTSYIPDRLSSVPVQSASQSVQRTEKVLSESRVTTVIRQQALAELATDVAKYDAVVTSCATSVNLVQSTAVPVTKSPLSLSRTAALEMPAINFPDSMHFDNEVEKGQGVSVKLTPSVQVNTYGIAVDEHSLPASQTTPSWAVTRVSAEEIKTPKHQATVTTSTVHLQNIVSPAQNLEMTTADSVAPAEAAIVQPLDALFSRAATTAEELLRGTLTPYSKPVNMVTSNSQTSELMRGSPTRSPPTVARVAAVNSRSAADENRLVRPQSTVTAIIGRTPVQTASEIPVLASVASKPAELAEKLATALAESMISAMVSDSSPAGLVDAITEVAMRGASRTALKSQQSVPESRTSVIVRNPTRGAPPVKIKKTPVSTASVSFFEGMWPSISTPVVLVNPSLTSAPHEVTPVRMTTTPSTVPTTHGPVISGEHHSNERRASDRVKTSGSVSGTPVKATVSVVRHEDGARRLTATSSSARSATKNSGMFPAEQLPKDMLMTSEETSPFVIGVPSQLRSEQIPRLGTTSQRVSEAARAGVAAAQQEYLRGSLVLPESQAAILLANVALGAAEAATIALQEVALGISTVGADHGGVGVGVGHRGSGRRQADGSDNEEAIETRERAQAIAADLAGRIEDMAAAAAVASNVVAASETISQHATSAVARTLLHDRRPSGVTRGSSRDSMSDRGTVIRVQGPAVAATDLDDVRRPVATEMQVRLRPSAASALGTNGQSVTKLEKSVPEPMRQANAQPSHSRAPVPTEQQQRTAEEAVAFPRDWNAPAVLPRRVSDPAGKLALDETEQSLRQERRMSVKQPLMAIYGREDHLGPPLRIRLWTSFNPQTILRPSPQQRPLSSQQTLRRESDRVSQQQRRGSQPAADSRERIKPQSNATPRRATIDQLSASSDDGADWQCTALTAAGMAATAAATAGGAYLLASSIAGQALLPTSGDLPTALDVFETIDLGL